MATDEATKHLNEAGLAADFPAAERPRSAAQVGIAALKFADLTNHRTSNYLFDLERFTRFEGKMGPYVQYKLLRRNAPSRQYHRRLQYDRAAHAPSRRHQGTTGLPRRSLGDQGG
jgi:arginyl-tRNA synthetase